MRKHVVAAFVSAAFFPVAANALDLLHTYAYALSNDPTYRSAQKDSEAGAANRVIGRSQLMPRINYSYWTAANNLKQSGSAYTGGPNQIYNKAYPSDNQTVQLNQPLFNLQALAMYRQGMAQGDLSDAKLVYHSQDLIVRVLQAYTDLLFAEDQLAFQTAERNAYKEQLKVNERMYEKGEGTKTDVFETRAAFATSEAKVIEATDAVENNKRKLEALIGEPIKNASEVKKLSSNFRIEPIHPKIFDDWKDTALGSNAELTAMKHQVEIARQGYLQNKAAHYPTVSGFASWNQQNSYTVVTVNQQNIQSMVGIQVNVPIFSGGETVGKTSQARSQYEKAQADYDATRDRIITELKKQFDAVTSSAKRVEALTLAVSSASQLTDAMRKSIRGGVRINFDALIADKQLASTQRDLSQAKYNYLLAALKLKQQAGTLTTEDLERCAANFQRDSLASSQAKAER